jgi:hypothetical protein
MEGIRKIEFGGQIKGSKALTFDRAELLPLEYGYVPLVLIKFSIMGHEQPLGLRLDLDKRAFLDNLDSQEMQDVLEVAAEQIAEFVQENWIARSHNPPAKS